MMDPKGIFTIPHVVEGEGAQERRFDLFSRLLMDRIIILGSEVNELAAGVLVGQLLYLQSADPKKDIHFYINSPGGSVTAGLAIYDTMQMLSCDVCTYCMGQAASMGAVLLAAGAKDKRYALPNARIMIHQPWGGMQGTAADIHIQATEILRLRQSLNEILAHHTGSTVEKLEKDTERDFFMSAADAVNYGLVDSVLGKDKDAKDQGKDKDKDKKDDGSDDKKKSKK